MRIGIDVQSTLGAKTGIGSYAVQLLAALRRVAPEHEYVELSRGHDIVMRLDRRLRWQQFDLPRRAAAARLDVLHVPGFDAPARRPCPVVLTVHDLIGMLFPANLPPAARMYWSRWLPFSVRFASQIVADSENTRQDILRLLDIPESRISVVPLAAGPQYLPLPAESQQAVRDKYGLQRPFILFVSTIEPRKGVDTLIEAFGRLCAHDPGHDLAIIGKRGWYTDRLLAQAAASGLGDRIVFTGYVLDEDLPPLYNAATVLAFPSRYEGFGLPVLEAMACGTPVVAAGSSSVPEVAGDAALLVPPGRADALAGALIEVLGSPSLRAELRERGLTRAGQFSWERTAAETLAVYDRACGNASRDKYPGS